MELYLSKSKYCAGVQCPKMLWMKKNKPEEFDESVMDQVVLDNGSEVGDLAMGLFGDYVEVPFDRDLGKMIKKTEELLEAGTSSHPSHEGCGLKSIVGHFAIAAIRHPSHEGCGLK